LEVHHAEGAATNRQRLEVLEEQEELIQDENKQEESAKETIGTGTIVKDDQNLDDKEEARRAEEESERADKVTEAQETEKHEKANENEKSGTKS
jgi:LETM1 and EF-hand domain-containing protein 1, mitochondrial